MNGIFDDAVFSALREEIGHRTLIEILSGFLVETRAAVAALSANCEVRPLVKRQAHSLKSAAGMLGFAQLSRLAGELEVDADTADLASLRGGVLRVEQAFESAGTFARRILLARRD